MGLVGKNDFSYGKAREDHTAPSIDGAYSVQTHKVLQLAERDRFYCCLMSYEKISSYIILGGRGRDTSVKRSTGIARPDHGYAANLETQGAPGPDFSAAKSSTDAGHNGNQQPWA